MKPTSYSHWRSPSYQQQTNSPRAIAPLPDHYTQQKLDNVEYHLNQFDDRVSKLDLITKTPQHDNCYTFNKRTVENGPSDYEQRYRPREEVSDTQKIEGARRLNTTEVENRIRELTQKTLVGAYRPTEPKQEENGQLNERVSGIERRMDMMDKKIDKLTVTLEAFMQRFGGEATHTPPKVIPEYRNYRPEQSQETNETIAEVKLIKNGRNRYDDILPTHQQSVDYDVNIPRRAASRDTQNVRDNLRHDLGLKEQKPDAQSQDKLGLRLDRGERFERPDRIERPVERVEKVERNERVERVERPEREDRLNRSERYEDKDLIEARVPRGLKSGLKSPETDRRKKSVSWSQECTPQGKKENESGQKRKRTDANDEYDNLETLKTEESIKAKERARTAIRPRERIEEKSRGIETPQQKTLSGSKEENTFERFGRYGEARVEAENIPERTIGRSSSGKPEEKDKTLEEKRRKIDEEIERRITKQVELRKRTDTAVESQVRVYEKTAQVEEDFKISPFSTEKSRDKEVVSRLVREKQMRNELISKYSGSAVDTSKRSRSPIN